MTFDSNRKLFYFSTIDRYPQIIIQSIIYVDLNKGPSTSLFHVLRRSKRYSVKPCDWLLHWSRPIRAPNVINVSIMLNVKQTRTGFSSIWNCKGKEVRVTHN